MADQHSAQSGSQIEWTVWSSAGKYALGSVGGREANEVRLRHLELSSPGQFHLVYREIGPWKRETP